MIEILADSPDDGALIARAIGSDTRVVNNSVRFANGGAHTGRNDSSLSRRRTSNRNYLDEFDVEYLVVYRIDRN